MKKTLLRITVGSLMLLVAAGALTRVAAQEPDPAEEARLKELYKEPADLFRNGKIDESFEKLKEISKKDSTLPPPRLTLARWLLSNQQTVQAGRTILEIAIVENGDHPEVYLQNAQIALNEGRITDALLNCQIALQLTEGGRWNTKQRKEFKKQARGGLAAAFEARKDWANAKTQLNGWLELDEKNGQIRQRLARAIFMTKNGDEAHDAEGAFKELQLAAKDDPTLDPPEVSMAILYASQDLTEPETIKKAREWFGKAVKAAESKDFKKKDRVHQAYGGWLLDIGDLKGAADQIAEAAKLAPATRETLTLEGLEARYNRDYPGAEKLFQQVINLYPGDFFASNQLALVLIEQKDSKQQQRGLQHAEVNARQYPRSAEAVATLGWAYYKTGKLDEAERILAVATSSGQASADTAYYLAKVLFDRKKYDEALETLDKALDSKGVFVNREAAKEWLPEVAKLGKRKPKEDKKGTEDKKEKKEEPKKKVEEPKSP